MLITGKVQYVPISFFTPGIQIQAGPPPPLAKTIFAYRHPVLASRIIQDLLE